ncbi:hypothetical protein Golob_023919 [Gossypium lobatum]|uniref:Terpene synthase metal-binding domain-containing protein n=1 Tax=Gossypium lobatum TaxID=34289 RepID=A0A7J8NEN6_9ROSI|nr:hypothetical protein [Gossypium lobatum]
MVEDALNTLGLNILPYIKDQWSSSNLFYLPSLITRLLDDLTTSKVQMERGETTNSIQCYMIQGVSEEEARDHIKDLICDSWKKLNKLVAGSSLSTGFAETALAMTRCVQRMYQFSDWFGIQSKANKDGLNSCIW